MRPIRHLLLLGAFITTAAYSAESSSPLTAGAHTITLKHDGRERSYIVHVPKDKRNLSRTRN